MDIVLQKRFSKQYKKLPTAIQLKFLERVAMLVTSPFDPRLNIHRLHGELLAFQSMNITGDYRALFVADEELSTITFFKIGTHIELYG